MSTMAERVRSKRQQLAAPGSAHDRLIAVARLGLPLAVIGLVLLLGLAPLATSHDISFVLAKDRVDVAHERMRVADAVYRGQDAKGQPFQLAATSAVQQTSADPVVRLNTLAATIMLADGPARITAPRGRYDMQSERVAIDGPVRMTDSTGYRVATRDVLVDLKSRRFASRAAVTGETPMGRFSADRLQGDLTQKVVVLTGRARLHIAQGGSKGAR